MFRIFWGVEYHEIFLLSKQILNKNTISNLSGTPVESQLLTNYVM